MKEYKKAFLFLVMGLWTAVVLAQNKLKVQSDFGVSGDVMVLNGNVGIATDRPNIILIFMDDLGYNDIGAFTYPVAPDQDFDPVPSPSYGISKSALPAPNLASDLTPNIDTLATGGMTLTNFYASAFCSPSRATLLTGRYDRRINFSDIILPTKNKGLNTFEVTIPEMLNEIGYNTAMVGKWHMGYFPSGHNPFQMMPLRHGFQEFYGTPHSNDMDDYDLIRDETILIDHMNSDAEQQKLTWLYTEAALEYIERFTAEDKPFFIYLPYNSTHDPVYPSNETFTNADGTIWPKFRDTTGHGWYYDVVSETDFAVGRILQKLEDLGISDNTMIIFSSDNGPQYNHANNFKIDASGSGYPLHNGKSTTWEGGIRVPFAIKWPDFIAAGSTSNQTTGIADILPTIAAITGASLPDDRVIDGIDISPLWADETWTTDRTYAVFDTTVARGSVTYVADLEAVVEGNWKIRNTTSDPNNDSIYDFSIDIQERTDLSDTNTTELAELRAQWAAIATSISSDTAPSGRFTNYEVDLSGSHIDIPEGSTSIVQIKLTADPGKTVVVSTNFYSGDSDLSILSGDTLTFTSADWDQPQNLTIGSLEDADSAAGGATFHITTDDIIHTRTLTVIESDDEAVFVEASILSPSSSLNLIQDIDTSIPLEGSVSLSGSDNPVGSTYAWLKVNGPGDVIFSNANAKQSSATFSAEGTYTLRFVGDHPAADKFGSADMAVVVGGFDQLTVEREFKNTPTLAYASDLDTNANSTWENRLNSGTFNFSMSGAVIQTTEDPAPAIDFIDSAWDFPGGTTTVGGSADSLDSFSTGDASIEIWFKPDTLPANTQQVLWESGGVIGASITLSASTLTFAVDNSGSGNISTYDLLNLSPIDGFYHVIGVIDLGADTMTLYVNGTARDSDSLTISDWTGTSGMGVSVFSMAQGNSTTATGSLGANTLFGGSFSAFEGLVAYILFYDRALTLDEVGEQFGGPLVTADAATALEITELEVVNQDSSLRAHWFGADAVEYRVWISSDLKIWNADSELIVGEDALTFYELEIDSEHQKKFLLVQALK